MAYILGKGEGVGGKEKSEVRDKSIKRVHLIARTCFKSRAPMKSRGKKHELEKNKTKYIVSKTL